MEIKLEQENQKAQILISLKEEDYQPKVAEKIKEYSKKANIKGFRPGKVPAGLINKMYGKSVLVDEINHMISHSLSDYIKENKLNVVGEPLPAEENNNVDWDNQKNFDFAFNIGLVPEFDVDLGGLKETKYKIKIDDKVVNETIDNLKSQFGEMVDAEQVEEGDFVVGEVKEVNGDFYKDHTMFPLERIKEDQRKLFLGKKVDDVIKFDINKTFEDASAIAIATGMEKEDAEKASGEFEITVKSIRRKQLAEVNQEFFDKIFGPETVKTEEEFRAKLSETIQENYERETEALLTRDIENHLVEKTEIQVPDEFLKEWLYKTNKEKFGKEEIDSQYDRFRQELKWNLIRNKIMEKNDIKAEHEDVIEKAKVYIRQQFGNMPINEDMEETMNKIADNYLKQDNGKAYMQTYEAVVLEKTVGFIKEQIEVSEKEVTLDEFKKAAGIEEEAAA